MPNYVRSLVWKVFMRMVSKAYSAPPSQRVRIVEEIMNRDLRPYLFSNVPTRIANTALRVVAFMEAHDEELARRKGEHQGGK
jgi:hypothetical protein